MISEAQAIHAQAMLKRSELESDADLERDANVGVTLAVPSLYRPLVAQTVCSDANVGGYD